MNEQGMLEAGLDYGGLVKEFLEQVGQALQHLTAFPCLALLLTCYGHLYDLSRCCCSTGMLHMALHSAKAQLCSSRLTFEHASVLI